MAPKKKTKLTLTAPACGTPSSGCAHRPLCRRREPCTDLCPRSPPPERCTEPTGVGTATTLRSPTSCASVPLCALVPLLLTQISLFWRAVSFGEAAPTRTSLDSQSEIGFILVLLFSSSALFIPLFLFFEKEEKEGGLVHDGSNKRWRRGASRGGCRSNARFS